MSLTLWKIKQHHYARKLVNLLKTSSKLFKKITFVVQNFTVNPSNKPFEYAYTIPNPISRQKQRRGLNGSFYTHRWMEHSNGIINARHRKRKSKNNNKKIHPSRNSRKAKIIIIICIGKIYRKQIKTKTREISEPVPAHYSRAHLEAWAVHNRRLTTRNVFAVKFRAFFAYVSRWMGSFLSLFYR